MEIEDTCSIRNYLTVVGSNPTGGIKASLYVHSFEDAIPPSTSTILLQFSFLHRAQWIERQYHYYSTKLSDETSIHLAARTIFFLPNEISATHDSHSEEEPL